MEPAAGLLEPGGRCNVRVTFTPLLGREAPYTLGLPLKIANNPKGMLLTCSGRGFTPKVRTSGGGGA